MSATVNNNDVREELVAKYGEVWNTTEMQEHFTVIGFCYGVCVVTRKSDGVKGCLEFTHMPRFYYGFRESK